MSKPAATASRVNAYFVDVDAEPSRKSAHLTFEIPLQIRIVDEHNVRLLTHLPEGSEVMHRRRKADVGQFARCRVVHPTPEALERIGRRRFPIAKHLNEILIPNRTVASSEESFEIKIVRMGRPQKSRDIARVAPNADVRDRLVVRQTVKRRMRLDEASMPLGVEVGNHQC